MSENKINEFEAFRDEAKPSKKEVKPTILIIDDDIHVREALKIIFEKKYNIVSCSNGELGIQSVNQNVFVVVLDIKMEGKNGFDTFVEIKRKNAYLPIIFLTAYQDIKDPLEIMNDYRPFGYIIKGADSKQLLDTVESAVEYYEQINKNTFLVKALQSKNIALQELRESLEEKVEKRTEEIKDLLKEKEIILKEVHHRIKNNMTTLKSILALQSALLEEESARHALGEAESRIHSMMVLYDKLYLSLNFEELSVSEYIPSLAEQIIRNFPNHTFVNLTLKVEDFILDARRLQTIGIIVNEILTNTMKYAFTNRTDGQILLEMGLKPKSKGQSLAFVHIQDNGNGITETLDFKKSTGFGLRLIELLARQIKGEMKFEEKKGIQFTLEFDL